MEQKRCSWWALPGMVAVAVATLLGGYVGLYYVMVSPRDGWALPTRAEYAVGGQLQSSAEVFFWPIHRLDRKLRPEAWRGFWDLPMDGLYLDEAEADEPPVSVEQRD